MTNVYPAEYTVQQTIAEQIERCRVCGGTIEKLFSLGEQYIVDFPLPNQPQTKAPLNLVKCKGCQLVQLAHTVNRDLLFRHFWYRSGISKSMTGSLKEIADEAMGLLRLKNNDVVLDIGSNDGTLLRQYPEGLWIGGFEPAFNVAVKSMEFATVSPNYFNAGEYWTIFGKRARVITSIAMFYDLEDPRKFVSDVSQCLDHEGVWIIQMNYLPAMLKNNCYDNICHEHVEYYSLSSLKALIEPYGLEVFRVQENHVNGGSFRVHIGFTGVWPIEQSVSQMLDSELEQDLDRRETYLDFKKRITEETLSLWDFVVEQARNGARIYVYGASTRGSVILQYAKLDRMLLPKACDANPDKWGRVMVGSNIPIVSKEEARKGHPDRWLVLPYHFLDEIMEEEGRDQKYVVPLPKFRVINS